MRVTLALLLLSLGAVVAQHGACAGEANGSIFAIPLVEGAREPTLILAQRTITRGWGMSEESTYVEVSVPDWKSEGWAFALSGVVPGAGHVYLGENAGLIFALVEVGGWFARRQFDHSNDVLRQEASVFRGNPEDTSSAWSFTRWEQNTGGDPTGIRALYEHDPEDFDVRIGRDPVYDSGWAQGPVPPKNEFLSFLDGADDMLQRKHFATTALWVNHLAAAFDALRAARIHNLPLRQNLRVQVKTAWRAGSPALRASLEGRF